MGFNPRPARGPGAAAAMAEAVPVEVVVSILAQPGGRALHLSLFPKTKTPLSFNPRPARGPGAAELAEDWQALELVSILAQPGGRALH